MRFLMNLLRGTVRVTLRGPFPERVINLCAQMGASFWAVEWEDANTLTMTVLRRDMGKVKQAAQQAMCTLEGAQGRGLPHFLGRFRRRYAFWVGFSLSLLAVCLLSNVVFTIEVTGNERLSTAQILTQLRRLGAAPGAYGPGLETKYIAEEAVRQLDGLSWMAINRWGTRLEVIVRETVPAPEILDETGYGHVVAQAGGIILDRRVYAGQAVVEEGDTVAPGDILISGDVRMMQPMFGEEPVYTYQTRARGLIYARTWRTLQASIPMDAWCKAYTGEERSLVSLTCLGRRVNFYQNSSISWEYYDKITLTTPLRLPGGVELPVAIQREVVRAYQPQTVQVNLGAAQDLLEERLLDQLQTMIGEDGQVLSTQWEAKVEGGLLTVTLTAECREEIGEELPLSPQEDNQR